MGNDYIVLLVLFGRGEGVDYAQQSLFQTKGVRYRLVVVWGVVLYKHPDDVVAGGSARRFCRRNASTGGIQADDITHCAECGIKFSQRFKSI